LSRQLTETGMRIAVGSFPGVSLCLFEKIERRVVRIGKGVIDCFGHFVHLRELGVIVLGHIVDLCIGSEFRNPMRFNRRFECDTD
jgi:hypothetical protein